MSTMPPFDPSQFPSQPTGQTDMNNILYGLPPQVDASQGPSNANIGPNVGPSDGGNFRNGLKQALGMFLLAAGRGYAAGGGMQGMGVALTTPQWQADQQRQLQEHHAALQSQAQQQEIDNQLKLAQIAHENSLTNINNAPGAPEQTIPGEQIDQSLKGQQIPLSVAKVLAPIYEKRGASKAPATEVLKGMLHWGGGDQPGSVVLNKETNQLIPLGADGGMGATPIPGGMFTQGESEPKTEMAMWLQQHPKSTIDDWLKAKGSEAQTAKDTQLSQNSYQAHVKLLSDLEKPIAEAESRYSNLRDNLAMGTPQGDALVAPQLLSFAAGGQGSGIRINNAEIERTVGGRSNWESLKASLQQWATDPKKANSITPDQRQQIQALTELFGQKLVQKRQTIADAISQLAQATDPMAHRKIYADTQQKLASIDRTPSGGNQQASGVRIRDPKNGRTGTFNGTAKDAVAKGYEVVK